MGRELRVPLETAAGRCIWISGVVLVETIWVLSAAYEWKKPQILAMLEKTTASRDFSFQSLEAVRAALDLYRKSKADFPDCLALEMARAEGHLPFLPTEVSLGDSPPTETVIL